MQRWYRSVKATGNKGHHIRTISAMAFGATGLVFRKKKRKEKCLQVTTDTLEGTVTSPLFIDRI